MPEVHYINRSNWLRAAVLGANDGILSTASVAIGVAAASDIRNPIVLASLAALVAGALSMAAGEYVSVSSQLDIESADIDREKAALIDMPEMELVELAQIYEERGLDSELAMRVAVQLTDHNALEAHTRDELGINEVSSTNPLQAAFASGAAFVLGGMMPMLVSIFAPVGIMVVCQYLFALVFLILLGITSAKTGGTKIINPVLRITFWGTVAMGFTALVGYLFNVSIG